MNIVMFELTEATWVKSYPTNSEIFEFNPVTVLNPAIWVASSTMIAAKKTIRVFTGPQISGGEYSETNLNYYGPTMPTKTIRVFSRFQISGSEYFKTNNGIAIDMRPMPKPNISLPTIIML